MEMKDLQIIEKEDYYVVLKDDQYFRLGISEGKVLNELQAGHSLEKISDRYDVSKTEIECFIESLKTLGVLGEKKREKKNLLYYRVKLFNPDKYFQWVVDHISKNNTVNQLFIISLGIICIVGIVLLVLNSDKIFTNMSFQITIKNLFLLYVATIFTVFSHELGHGLVCKYHGGNVKEIGFLFICGSPALFCDVSGIREFNEKKKILQTLLAGVFVQLIITAVAVIISININGKNTLLNAFVGWNLLMMLSNLLPITKLDGYWIFSTLLNIPNLYDKSIKLALGKKNNVLFNEYEESKAGLIKLYGMINLLIMSGIIICMTLGGIRIKLESGNVLSTGLNIFKGMFGFAMMFYLFKVILKVRREK